MSQFKSLMSIRNDLELNLAKYENGAMVPPAERFKNTSNRLMMQGNNKKTSLPTQGSGSIKPATVSSAGNKRSSIAAFTKQASAAFKKSQQEENYVVTKPLPKPTSSSTDGKTISIP